MITLDIKLSPLFQNSEQTTLNDISVKVKAGKLLAVIGPVGAGKVRYYLVCVININHEIFIMLYYYTCTFMSCLLYASMLYFGGVVYDRNHSIMKHALLVNEMHMKIVSRKNGVR